MTPKPRRRPRYRFRSSRDPQAVLQDLRHIRHKLLQALTRVQAEIVIRQRAPGP